MSEAEVILPRELTDVSDEVRDVPPPPIPELPAPYGLRLADPDADAEMIAGWMSRPHLAEAWESVWPASRWQRYLGAQLGGELLATVHRQPRRSRPRIRRNIQGSKGFHCCAI